MTKEQEKEMFKLNGLDLNEIENLIFSIRSAADEKVIEEREKEIDKQIQLMIDQAKLKH
jgi:hypothetical protein